MRRGPAADTMAQLAAADRDRCDLVFIDADKPSTGDYLSPALQLTRPGSLIVIDFVVRDRAGADAPVGIPGLGGRAGPSSDWPPIHG